MLMKKVFTSLCALALASLPTMAQTLYSTSFANYQKGDFDSWTVNDANQDEKTWGFSEEGSPSTVFYSYHGSNQADDWLISPQITPEADAQVMVKFNYKGSSYGEAMEVYCENAAPDATTMTNKVWEQEVIKDSEQGGYFFYQAKAGEPFRIGFHATSPKDKWRLYLIDVEVVVADHPVDLKVTEVLSPVTGDGLSSETVKIKVANVGVENVSSFKLGFSLDDGTPVEETVNQEFAVGDTIEYTFTQKADLSEPRHLYNVKAFAYHEWDINHLNDTLAVKVRHNAPAAVPYYMGFEPDEYTDGIKFFNLNEDSGDFELNISSGWFTMSRTGFGCLAYNYDKNNNADDWAILEGINVKAGYHALKFWYSATENHPEKFAVYWGTEPTIAAMTNKIVEYNPASNAKYAESINLIDFPADGTVYIAFHCFSDKDENWLTIDDLSLTEVSSTSVDLALNAIASPYDYIRNASEHTLKLDLRNIGIIDADATVKVLADSVEIAQQQVNLVAQEYKTVELTDILANLTEGTHQIKVTVECEKDDNLTNNELEKTVTVLGAPTLYWDFEDDKLPEEFAYAVEDEGTVNANAGDEYNEQGWGIFSIGEHAVLGSKVLAGCSWIDNPGSYGVDRRLLLPRISVKSEGAHFVFNANSYNAKFLEDFKIMLCDDPDSSWGVSYSTKATCNQESIWTKAHGLDLSSYVGKDVLLAIAVVSKDGEALILDNIGLYGDVELSSASAIGDVVSEKAGHITILDNAVVADGSIAIIDAAGRKVASAEGRVDLAGLKAGIYMANVKNAKGSKTVKFIKK